MSEPNNSFTREISKIAESIKFEREQLLQKVQQFEAENAELKAINKEMYEALECACDKYCIGYAGDSLVKCEDCIIRKVLCKARGEEE